MQKTKESFNRSFRASLANIRMFSIKIPILENGSFDIELQNSIATYFIELKDKKSQLDSMKNELNRMMTYYLASTEI